MRLSTLYARNLLRYGRIDPIEYLVSHEMKLVYVPIAKAGCTAIKQALLPDLSYGNLGLDEFHRQVSKRMTRRRPEHLDNYLWFTFAREPARRLASCHADKIVGGGGIFATRAQKAIFRLCAGAPAQDASLVAFAEAVADIPDRLRDRHIAAQAPVLRAVTSAPRHFVGRIEMLARDWERLQEHAPLPEITRLNTSTPIASNAMEYPAFQAAIARAYASDIAMLRDLAGTPT